MIDALRSEHLSHSKVQLLVGSRVNPLVMTSGNALLLMCDQATLWVQIVGISNIDSRESLHMIPWAQH